MARTATLFIFLRIGWGHLANGRFLVIGIFGVCRRLGELLGPEACSAKDITT